jgi:hypothetical protein
MTDLGHERAFASPPNQVGHLLEKCACAADLNLDVRIVQQQIKKVLSDAALAHPSVGVAGTPRPPRARNVGSR